MTKAQRNLNEKERRFVDLYCEIGDPYGIKAAEIVEGGRKCMELYFLTRPEVQAAITAKGGPTPVIVVRPLTAVEHKFIDKYLETLDVAIAAAHVGITTVKGREWFKRPHFKHELNKRLDEIRHNSVIKAEEVLEELAVIAFADITDYVQVDQGRLTIKNTDDMSGTSAIAEISEGANGLKLKLYNKITALENLGKYLGLFKERVELTGKDGEAIKIESPADAISRKLDVIASNNAQRDGLSSPDEDNNDDSDE